ncbi:MAG: NUDIX hydrolase [Povalibacter sp.]
MQPGKACPVVIRGSGPTLAVMAFRHPLSGCQLVKGTIEPGESAAEAAVRELLEESGVQGSVTRDLGIWHSGHKNQLWSFHLCRPTMRLRNFWSHRCMDDGGQIFDFFWQPLYIPPLEEWHPVHIRALDYVRRVMIFSSESLPA